MFKFKSIFLSRIVSATFLLFCMSGCALVNQIESAFRSDQSKQEMELAKDTSSRLERTAQATRGSRRDLAGDPDLDKIAKELEKIEERRRSVGSATAVKGEVTASTERVVETVQTEAPANVAETVEKASVQTAAAVPSAAEVEEAVKPAMEKADDVADAEKTPASSALDKVKSLLGVGEDEQEDQEEQVAASEESAAVEDEEDKAKSESEETLAKNLEEAKDQVESGAEEAAEEIAAKVDEAADSDKLAKALEEAEQSVADSEEADQLAKTLAEESEVASAADARAMLGDTTVAEGQGEAIENAIRDAVPEGAAAQTKIPVWVFLLMAAALSIAGFGLLWVSRNT